ncbi:receptor expression-enhancing protein 2 isoform X7 [Drosophila subobscura]|uniref:receptor expression-enhancing protein 2 isoform X7 n=1 Tax=Drosophila subobscura TaxID=7241 RepID=UPI00155B3688|nr:receptor expression-enhancing protein 2 isoform X7 [Drosophila subobscura]
MSRPFYQQEPLAQRPIFYQRPVNIKRLRHPAGGVYGRSYSLEEQEDLQQQQQQHHHQENVVPVYQKFIYANQRHSNQLPLYQLGDSLSSLDSDFVDDYTGPYIVEQPVSPPPAPKVVQNLNALGWLLDLLQHWPLPSLSFNTACICALIIIFLAPRTCAQSLLFPAFRLFFGTLYPAYASYKAVRTKNVKEYVKWMMYWIVFAFFTCIETFTDIFISWFPFYYEVKVVLVFWLLSPATKGSSTLYRKFVHPMLTRHEQEIDEYLTQAKERGYTAVLQLGSKGVKYATNVIMQTAVKTYAMTEMTVGRSLQNSQSAGDLSAVGRNQDMMDGLEDWLPRSSSLSGIESYIEPEPQRRGMVIEEIPEEEPVPDAGAARLRDPPARRVQSRRAAAAASRAAVKRVSRAPDLDAPVAATHGVRARRRLREPTPDVDVEND